MPITIRNRPEPHDDKPPWDEPVRVPEPAVFDALTLLRAWHPKNKQPLVLTRKSTGEQFTVKAFDTVTGSLSLAMAGRKKPLRTRFTARENALYTARYQ